MDESVIFVGELRSGDSDICVCVCDPKDTVKGKKKSKKPLIDLKESGTTSSGNIDKNQSTKELEKNQRGTEKSSLECPVCFEFIQNVSEVKITNCGHVFCGNCLRNIVSVPRPTCPKCRRLIIKKQIRNVYF